MTPEQLASARAAHWREDAQPILTLDDAKVWLENMQLCLYLPRKTHVLAPAPSFAGAVLGASSATPASETIVQAHDLLVRLVTEGYVVPLNLFGVPGEQPDFLIRTSALSHLAALQADRNWKKAPARTGPGKVSPLAIEVWKLLDREGALTATEIRNHLGHELTEAATIRALTELWQNLRVAPLPQANGESANWEILSVTHKKEMAAGGTMAQSTALSLLVSYYLRSVLAATAEDIEAFLSPVASRTRLRDVIRGLSATRQLRTLSMDAQTFLFIEGSLPDAPAASPVETAAADKPAFMGRSAYRERMLHKVKEADAPKEDTSPSTYKERRAAASFEKPQRPMSDPPGTGNPPMRPGRFAADPGSRPARPAFSDRSRTGPSRSPTDRPSRPPSSRPFPSRPSAGVNGPTRTFRPRSAGDRPTQDRPGSSRPFNDRSGSRPPSQRQGPPFRDNTAARPARPFRPRTEGDRPAPDRPYRKESGGTNRPFTQRPKGDRTAGRPPFRSNSAAPGARPFRPRTEGDRSRTDRTDPKRSGEGRPFQPRSSNRSEGKGVREGTSAGERTARPPFRPRTASGTSSNFRRQSSSIDRSASRPASRSAGPDRPPRSSGAFTRGDGNPSRNPGRGDRPDRRPGRPGIPGRNPGGTGRPGTPKFGPPRASSRPGSSFGSRPASRPPSGPGAARPTRPTGPRPGGMRPPTRKPRKPESGSE